MNKFIYFNVIFINYLIYDKIILGIEVLILMLKNRFFEVSYDYEEDSINI